MSAEALLDFPSPAPDHTIPYGSDPLQFGELRLPEGDGPFPLIVFIHGGCWMAEYDIEHSRKLAAQFPVEGIASWSLEYRRVGNAGGGWPGTFDDIAAAYGQLETLGETHSLDLDRVILGGHSAGGHLALWLARRIEDEPRAGLIRPLGVLGLAPAADLEFLVDQGTCDDAARKLMGGTPEEYPERYQQGSLAQRAPMYTPQIAIVGKYDETWREVGVRYAMNAAKNGAPIRLTEAVESGHFEMIDPDSSTWPLVLTAAKALLGLGDD